MSEEAAFAPLFEKAPKWPPAEGRAGSLRESSAGWHDFAVVTTRSPYGLAEPLLAARPARVVFVESLERGAIERTAAELGGFHTIVGLGSGTAIDAAKALAKWSGAALVQVPTTASNNACFTRTAWTFVEGRRVAERDAPIPREIVVDTNLIAAAPPRLNAAGLAEILCSHTSLTDWRLGRDAGLEVDWDPLLWDFISTELHALEKLAERVGSGDPRAYSEIIERCARMAPLFTTHSKARFNAGCEHLFSWTLDECAKQRLVHGESVSLGVVLFAHIQDNKPEWVVDILKDAGIAFQPGDIGSSWAEVDRAIERLRAYAKTLPWFTILSRMDQQTLLSRYAEAKEYVKALAA